MTKRPQRPTPLPRPEPAQHNVDANMLFAQIGQQAVELRIVSALIAERDARIAELEGYLDEEATEEPAAAEA